MPRYLSLPNGNVYNVRLYDSIRVPFVLASDPFIDIRGANVLLVLVNARLETPARIEPVFRRLSAYRGEILYNSSRLSQTGEYSLRIVIDQDIITSANFSIFVDRKFIELRQNSNLSCYLPRSCVINNSCNLDSPSQ